MKKIAVVDIGSNTIRLCVYTLHFEKLELLVSKKQVAGLASYIQKEESLNEEDWIKFNLSEKGILKLIEVLKSFQMYCKNLGVLKVYPFATASICLVENKKEILKRVQETTGFSIELLSGKQEARYSFLGAVHFNHMDKGILIDIGGASTEIVAFEKNKIVEMASLNIGSLSAYTKYVSRILPTRKEQEEIKKETLELLDDIHFSEKWNGTSILGVGGTIRNTSKICNVLKLKSANEIFFRTDFLKEILKQIHAEKKECLNVVLKEAPHRIHTLIPGIIILKTIAKKFQRETLLGIIPCPLNTPEWIQIPEIYLPANAKEKFVFVSVLDLIATFASSLFSMYKVIDIHILNVTRNGDLTLDEESFDGSEDFRLQMKSVLKHRKTKTVVRLESNKILNDEIKRFVFQKLKVNEKQIFVSLTPFQLKFAFKLASMLPQELSVKLLYPKFEPKKAISFHKNHNL